jgi:Asp-tRNA(Asn)/Glu-tRNA(Gln) amidotransferase A subunit family amidase
LHHPQSKEQNFMSSNEKNSAANSAQDPNVIYYKDATELAALIRTKQLSSREVVQAHLDRISTVNPKINAIVTLMADDALKGAGVADEAVMSGAQLGPIYGVPFTIKNAIGFEIGPLFFGRGLTRGAIKKSMNLCSVIPV